MPREREREIPQIPIKSERKLESFFTLNNAIGIRDLFKGIARLRGILPRRSGRRRENVGKTSREDKSTHAKESRFGRIAATRYRGDIRSVFLMQCGDEKRSGGVRLSAIFTDLDTPRERADRRKTGADQVEIPDGANSRA